MDSTAAYTVSNVPHGTENQKLQVTQDKVRVELDGTYTLTDLGAVVVSTNATTGYLEIVGGSISLSKKNILVGGGWGGTATQHGTLIIDGTTVGVADYVTELGIGSQAGGTGDVTIRGGAKFQTSRGIDMLRMCDNGSNSLMIEGADTYVRVGRLVMGTYSSTTTYNICIVSNGAVLSTGTWRVDIGASGKGNLRVTGNGSRVEFSGAAGPVNVGTGSSKGLIEVLDGAWIRDKTSNLSDTYYGAGGSSRGSLLVEGTDSRYRVEKDGDAGIYAYFRTNGSTCVVRDGGIIDRDNGSKLIFEAGSFLGGDGTLDLPVDMAGTIKPGGTLDNDGWYDVTSGTGVMTLSTNLTMSSTAECQFELAGTGTGEYDSLTVGGNLVLDGDITVSLTNGFTYVDAAGTQFTVIDASAGTLSGSFDNAANGEWIDTGDPKEAFQVHYGPDSIHDPTSVVLTTKAMGTVILIQ